MRKKVKRALALVLAAAFIVTSVNDKQLFVSAETTESSENVSAVAEVAEPEEADADQMSVENAAPVSEVSAGEEEKASDPETPVSEEVTEVQEEEADEAVPTAEESVTESDEADNQIPAETVPAEEKQDETAPAEEVTEAPEMEVPEEEEAQAEETVYETSTGDVQVKVLAPDGALPAGSMLVAAPVVSEDVEASMSDENVEYEGYMALDIHFEYEGKEIEPELPVAVAFVLSENTIPADAETAVHHLVEDEQGNVTEIEQLDIVTPEPVETNAKAEMDPDETMESSKVVVVETESFSTFVITWKTTADGNVIDLPVTIQPVDQEGNSIGDGISDAISVEKTTEETVALDDIVRGKSLETIRANGHEYRYKFAASGSYAETGKIAVLNAGLIQTETNTDAVPYRYNRFKQNVTVTTIYYYGIWSGDTTPKTITDPSVIAYRSYSKVITKVQSYSFLLGWVDEGEPQVTVNPPGKLTTRKDVYLVYEKQADSILGHTDAVHLDKYVEQDEKNGDFVLTLSSYVTGTAGEEATDSDFVLVLDCSGSMKWEFGKEVAHSVLDSAKALAYGNSKDSNSYYTKDGGDSAVWYANGNWYTYGSFGRERRLNSGDSVYIRRIGALKEAACGFVDELYKQDSTGHYKVGIVSFSNNASINRDLTSLDNSSNVDALKNTILSLKADGSTYSDQGMKEAENVLRSSSARKSATKVAILFTDGGPGYSGWDSSDATKTANGAIGYAYNIKASTATEVMYNNGTSYGLGGKVYSISIVGNSNPDTTGNKMDKYMNYVSSNFPNAKSMDDSGTGGAPGTTYYKVANDVTELVKAFKDAAGSAGIALDASAEVRDYLAANFERRTGDLSDISVYTQNATGYSDGSYTFAENLEPYPAGVTAEGKVITVKGFNYSDAENYVSGAETGSFSGKKLVVKIRIKFSDANCFGGNNIPTNTSDTAIYAEADITSEGLEKVKQYPEPLVNMPVDYKATSKDQTIYVTNSANLNNMLDYVTSGTKSYLPNGSNNRYVDIVYSFSDGTNTYYYKIPAMSQANAGSWYSDETCTLPLASTQISGLLECKEYTVTCTVSPTEKPGKDNAGRNSVGAAAKDTLVTPEPKPAKVHVLYPQVSCEDQWIDIGDTINVSLVAQVGNDWYDPGNHSSIPAVAGTKPTVTIETRAYGGTDLAASVTPEKDTDYKLTVKTGTQDITEKTRITVSKQTQNTAGDQHTADCYDHTEADGHLAEKYDFRVHVIGYKVEIDKVVAGNMGDTSRSFPFTYKVVDTSGKGNQEGKFSLTDAADPYKILKVRKGSTVTVTETGSYNTNGYNTDGYKTTVDVNSGCDNTVTVPATYTASVNKNTKVTFTNEKQIQPPTGLEDDHTSYLIMLMSALGVAVWFGIMYVIRSRRRRH